MSEKIFNQILKSLNGGINYGISANSNFETIEFLTSFIKKYFNNKDFNFLDIGFSNCLIILYIRNRIKNKKLNFSNFKIYGVENDENLFLESKNRLRSEKDFLFFNKREDIELKDNSFIFFERDIFNPLEKEKEILKSIDVFYCFQFCEFEEIEKLFINYSKKDSYLILLKNNYKEHNFDISYIDQRFIEILEVKKIENREIYIFKTK